MSYQFNQLVIPGTGFLVPGAVVKPIGGRWESLYGKFTMPMTLGVFATLEESQTSSTILEYPVNQFLAMSGEDPNPTDPQFIGLPDTKVNGLTPSAWVRIKKAMLDQIYEEYALEYPLFANAKIV